MSETTSGAEVIYRTSHTGLAADEILIGVEQTNGLISIGEPPVYALSLTHKGTGCRTGAAYIAAQQPGVLNEWRLRMRLPRKPNGPFDGITFVTEDASLDTCLTVIQLDRVLKGNRIPDKWIDYAARWEAGEVRSTGLPEHSAAALHSALVHALFDRDSGIVRVKRALADGISYLEALIDCGEDPAALPIALDIPLHKVAHARLQTERQRYLRLRETFPKLQLAVPLAGTNRRRIVDAAILTETTPTGALKSFLRTDPDSYTGDGYAVFALFRPTIVGASDPSAAPILQEMSISVDPDLGLSLQQLWQELERREDEAWRNLAEERPRDRPRQLASFASEAAKWPIGLNPSNQPWFDGNGQYTIIASPRPLEGGRSGTKLSWSDVLSALWSSCAPGREINVKTRDSGIQGPLFTMPGDAKNLFGKLTKCSSKSLINVVRSDGQYAEPMYWPPTLSSVAAALTHGAEISIDRLPEPPDYDVISGRGGVVVVTNAGLFIMEHAHERGFPADKITEAVSRFGDVLGQAERLEVHLADCQQTVVDAVQTGRSDHKRKALAQVYGIMLDARPQAPQPEVAENDPIVLRTMEAIERRWNARARFEHVAKAAQTLESMIVSSSEVRTAALLNNVAIYGLPAAVFGNLLGVALNPWSGEHAPGIAWYTSWPVIGLYLFLMAGVTLILRWVSNRIRIGWAKDMENAKTHSNGS